MKLAAVVLAAGLGTRMKSTRAKVLHTLAGRALVTFPVQLALDVGCNPTIVVVGHQAAEVESLLDNYFGNKVEVAIQKEQLGTGHAVLSAKSKLSGFSGYVAILSGDVPLLQKATLRRLIGKVQKENAPIGFISAELSNATGYGRVVRDESGKIFRIVEHKDASREELQITEANMGIYVVQSKFLFSELRKIGKNNAQGEYYLPDLIQKAADRGRNVVGLVADENETSGINDRRQLAKLSRLMHERINEALMANGVTIEAPETVFISAESAIGHDTIIEPNVRLEGKVRIGSNCRIQTGSVISDSIIADEVWIKPYCVVENSKLDNEAVIGPFTHLRPGAHLDKGAKAGNFVEIKNARLKQGAKANHLSYIGDAIIGKKTNIGAGTITCNYDGYNKYKTVVGDEVLIGSDTQLIAPVKVPDRVVLGAGTSLTGKEKISKGDLVVTRSEISVKSGYRDELEKRSLALKKKKVTKKKP